MKFLLEKNGRLKYIKNDDENSSENILIDEYILIYDYIIDKSSIVHLVYLQTNGDLNYVILRDNEKFDSKIGKFDMKSNDYYQISILIVDNKLNIFYAYSNKINSNIYTLHHIIIDKNTREKYNILRFVSKKNTRTFVVDNDSGGNIHLFYNTISESFSYIFYTYFNPYKNQWLQNPVMISKSEKLCEYPSILIDHMDNIHGIWWEKYSDGYTLKYKRMSQTGKDIYKWIEINLPSIVQDIPESRLYKENNTLYIECSELTLSSNNLGNDWNIEYKDGSTNDEAIIESKSEEASTSKEEISLLHDEDNKNLDEKETININENILQQIFEEQDNIKRSISQIVDTQLLLKSKIERLEEQLRDQPKTGLKKFFSS
jgi:hypothetical protein